MSTQVTLRGRLTRDPEMRFTANGKPVATFAVVTSRRFKNEHSGDWEDRDITFWDCVAFGPLAENITESALEKGTAVVVTGNAYQEEWEDRNGSKRRSLKVTVDDIAPSLRWASVKIAKAERQSARIADGSSFDTEPPF